MLTHRFSLPMASRFEREMNHLLNSFLDGTPFMTSTPRVFPPVNVWEDAENVFAEAELPGLAMSDLEVLVVGNELTIKGRRGSQGEANVSYHRRERGTGEFARVLTLPTAVNQEEVVAALKDGVLTITLPKAEAAKPRKIQIKAS